MSVLNCNESIETMSNLEWHGYVSGSRVDFFYENGVDKKCTRPCEYCGFNYLDKLGNVLVYPNEPLCGVW